MDKSLGKVTKAFCVLLAVGTVLAEEPKDDVSLKDYSQWKLALGSGALATPVSISAPPGFEVELVRSATGEEGSWISLTFDDKGRVLIGREKRGILRLTFEGEEKPQVKSVEVIDDTLLEPRGFLLAHGSLYVTANNSKGLYRLRDTNGDDQLDEVKLLKQFEGGVGHGRNGMALGPDGKIYLALGNNVKVPNDVAANSPYRHYGLDRLLPCAWNEFLFDSDVTPPAGFVARTDADVESWEIVAGGFRNPYDLAFSPDGDLFTYDADMEWDLGAPWYRPTCVMHVVPGGEYGWRQGTSVWPDHFADALPRVADVGLGSPTGVEFGDKFKFPSRYRRSLFILDWAYGRIVAIPLTSKGSSFTGRVETFLKGKPLNVTDIAAGPDGAMYFTVGGRGTKSALYRVHFTGELRSEDARPASNADRATRQELEKLLTTTPDDAIDKLWPHLNSEDAFVRHTALAALENQPFEKWYERAIDETKPSVASNALLALARVAPDDRAAAIATNLIAILAQPLEGQDCVTALRAAQLLLVRHATLTTSQKQQLREVLEPLYPAKNQAENYLLTELLVSLRSDKAPAVALDLHDKTSSKVERLWYVYALRQAHQGWSLDLRRRYLAALKETERYGGAHYMPRFLTYIRTDAVSQLSEAEKTALAELLETLGREPSSAETASATPPVEKTKWTIAELQLALQQQKLPANAERGRAIYLAAQCAKCHRHGDVGIPFGPDLLQVGSRFGDADLLDAIVQPSRAIDDKYRTLRLETEEGKAVAGFLVGGDQESFFVAPDPLRPVRFDRIPRNSITGRTVSPLSPMPEGLLNPFTAEQVADLLAFLKSEEE